MVDQLIEIACDESGYEGEKLIGATTDVFAHGGVRLETQVAADCMQELRRRIRSPATEYKANHLLRQKHRSVLEWILGPLSPLHGNAHVYLIDKQFYIITKIVGLLMRGTVEEMATSLYRQGSGEYGSDGWETFLSLANTVMRSKDRQDTKTSVDALFQMIDSMRGTGPLGQIFAELGRARANADAFRESLLDNPGTISALDPLIPAIVQQVIFWGGAKSSVAIIHDRQTTLPEERIAQLKEMTAGRLAGLTLADSFFDPRVQLADVLAGTARKIASDELNGRGDPRLTALLRPYLDASSIWGDYRSWVQLAPPGR